MKKFCAALAFVIFAGIFNFCSAAPAVSRKYGSDEVRKQHDICKSNPNYIVVRDSGSYITDVIYFYSPSLSVKEYKPPHYKISGYFYDLYEDGRSIITDKIYYQVRYNWYTKESWHLEYYANDSGDLLNEKDYYWEKDGRGTDGKSEIQRQMADALFRAAYGMNFYGY